MNNGWPVAWISKGGPSHSGLYTQINTHIGYSLCLFVYVFLVYSRIVFLFRVLIPHKYLRLRSCTVVLAKQC